MFYGRRSEIRAKERIDGTLDFMRAHAEGISSTPFDKGGKVKGIGTSTGSTQSIEKRAWDASRVDTRRTFVALS